MAADLERERQALIAASISRLTHTAEWEMFLEHVREVETQLLESLVTAPTDWRYVQGRIQGLRDVLNLPAQLITRGRRP